MCVLRFADQNIAPIYLGLAYISAPSAVSRKQVFDSLDDFHTRDVQCSGNL